MCVHVCSVSVGGCVTGVPHFVKVRGQHQVSVFTFHIGFEAGSLLFLVTASVLQVSKPASFWGIVPSLLAICLGCAVTAGTRHYMCVSTHKSRHPNSGCPACMTDSYSCWAFLSPLPALWLRLCLWFCVLNSHHCSFWCWDWCWLLNMWELVSI